MKNLNFKIATILDNRLKRKPHHIDKFINNTFLSLSTKHKRIKAPNYNYKNSSFNFFIKFRFVYNNRKCSLRQCRHFYVYSRDGNRPVFFYPLFKVTNRGLSKSYKFEINSFYEKRIRLNENNSISFF